MRSLQKFGVCEGATWPLRVESVKWYPGSYAFFEAQRHMIRAYQYKRLNVKRRDSDRDQINKNKDYATMNKDDDAVLYNLCSCLSQGSPVVFGFRIFYVKDTIDWQKSDDFPFTQWCLPSVPRRRTRVGGCYARTLGIRMIATQVVHFFGCRTIGLRTSVRHWTSG